MQTIKFLAPNQCYFFSDGKIIFQSYETIVCTVQNYENGNNPIITITPGQPQSKTTAKYLNAFLKLHVGIDNYKNVKQLIDTPDLFETPELLPANMQILLNEYAEKENDYENCAALLIECEKQGFTFDYYLDAIPYNLRKI